MCPLHGPWLDHQDIDLSAMRDDTDRRDTCNCSIIPIEADVITAEPVIVSTLPAVELVDHPYTPQLEFLKTETSTCDHPAPRSSDPFVPNADSHPSKKPRISCGAALSQGDAEQIDRDSDHNNVIHIESQESVLLNSSIESTPASPMSPSSPDWRSQESILSQEFPSPYSPDTLSWLGVEDSQADDEHPEVVIFHPGRNAERNVWSEQEQSENP